MAPIFYRGEVSVAKQGGVFDPLTVSKSCCTVNMYMKGDADMLQTTYTNARANFAGLCDEVTENREIVVIRRRKGSNVAMIAADELQSLVESAHLMRSPKNAERLLVALERALKGSATTSSIESLRCEVGLEG